MSIVEEKILRAVSAYNMLEAGDRIVVGLSGGADSVTLLHGLKRLEKELGIELYACHINHNLRGRESDGDQAFAQQLCESLGVDIRVFSVDVTGELKKHQSTEEKARELRYDAFKKISESLNAKVATAHNACDNSETVLLNILRGTGLKGLCGIPPKREYIIRPLLFCTREEIEGYICENGLKYVTDKTNLSTAYTRNKVRLEVMPRLTEINPSLHAGISRMTSSLIEDSLFLEGMAKEALDKARIENGVYLTEALLALPKPIFTRAVSLMLKEKGVEPSALRINGIAEIIRSGRGKINLEKNKFAAVKKGKAEIQLIPQKYRDKNAPK
ncbi:MAG: tRNA lysidine(34) synthetase TilS [Firmicutes bacterium]|nr:tRNA lysidine(34) synthetase TilS [[Eubacterium] siraeum]MCM1487832.1 tRNA lysidine(34) synthetase TilS [Bacillota bacterium]